MAKKESLKIAVTGASGRMGKAVIRAIAGSKGVKLHAALARAGGKEIGKDAGALAGIEPLGVTVTADAAKAFKGCDVVIDFTRPDAMAVYAKAAAKAGAAFISGTTGLKSAQEAVLKAVAKQVPVLWAANMSLGVALLQALVEQAAAALGPEFDIEIIEMHHRRKEDAPSGTALALGQAAAKGRKASLAKVQKLGRQGITGPRKAGEIGFAAVRGGDVAGDHEVIFAGDSELLTLSHRALNRDIFATGALKAARLAVGRKPGLYGVQDILPLKTKG